MFLHICLFMHPHRKVVLQLCTYYQDVCNVESISVATWKSISVAAFTYRWWDWKNCVWKTEGSILHYLPYIVRVSIIWRNLLKGLKYKMTMNQPPFHRSLLQTMICGIVFADSSLTFFSPICLDEIKGSDITYCRFGCGNNLHVDCLNHYAHHALSTGNPIKCPVSTFWNAS